MINFNAISLGSTPVRRSVEYDELEDLPPAAELLKNQLSSNTPRRQSGYYVRESMLESEVRAALLSPTALKSMSTIKTKFLETVNENSSEEQQHSKRTSTCSD